MQILEISGALTCCNRCTSRVWHFSVRFCKVWLTCWFGENDPLKCHVFASSIPEHLPFRSHLPCPWLNSSTSSTKDVQREWRAHGLWNLQWFKDHLGQKRQLLKWLGPVFTRCLAAAVMTSLPYFILCHIWFWVASWKAFWLFHMFHGFKSARLSAQVRNVYGKLRCMKPRCKSILTTCKSWKRKIRTVRSKMLRNVHGLPVKVSEEENVFDFVALRFFKKFSWFFLV